MTGSNFNTVEFLISPFTKFTAHKRFHGFCLQLVVGRGVEIVRQRVGGAAEAEVGSRTVRRVLTASPTAVPVAVILASTTQMNRP